MTHATSRALRRAIDKIGTKRKKPLQLKPFFDHLDSKKIPASVAGNARGHKVCVRVEAYRGRIAPHVIRTFIHPTKKATRGRMVVVKSAA